MFQNIAHLLGQKNWPLLKGHEGKGNSWGGLQIYKYRTRYLFHVKYIQKAFVIDSCKIVFNSFFSVQYSHKA